MHLEGLAADERKLAAELRQRRPIGGRRPRLGEILVASGAISESDLNAALARKATTGRRIGEELVATGIVSADRLSRALRLQRKLIVAALFSAFVGHSHAADVRAFMSVTANVVETVGVRSMYQARDIDISAEDIERGYVEISAASRIEIRNSKPSLIEFRTVGDVFRSVTVKGAAAIAEFGARGGSLLQKPSGSGVSELAFDYRFELTAGVKPGRHKWPLALTVLPL